MQWCRDEEDTQDREAGAAHESGVLVTLADIPPGRTTLTIEGQRSERIRVASTYRVRLQPVGTSWKPVE
jgi:hypothetical protein